MPRPITSGPYRTMRRLLGHETFLEFEGSTITIPMKAKKSPDGPWMEEEIKLRAFMRLEIFPAYVNNLGTREFQFIIRDWDLYGKSVMLNQLFFDHPLGYFHPDYEDPVPAVVTFNVSNNYQVQIARSEALKDGTYAVRYVDLWEDAVARALFAGLRDLEIRNLTSHDLRFWYEEEATGRWTYSLPGNSIYWELLDLGPLKDKLPKEITPGLAVVFHKKPLRVASRTGEIIGIDLDNHDERARYLLGVAGLRDEREEGGPALPVILATLPRRPKTQGHAIVRESGNTVLSSLYRPRTGAQIRWRFLETFSKTATVGETLKKVGRLGGRIRIVSPSKSLGTADQAPDVGAPVDSTDFPARITYAINYNIFVNRERFVEDQSGIAVAVGADQVPPRDVVVAFDKPHVGHVLAEFLEFGPGHCTGMHEIPEEAYRQGLDFCRYWRGVPLAITEMPDFDPYNPPPPEPPE